MQHEEPEFEALLRRLIPGIEQHWEGASKEEYQIVEWLVEVPLPPFYQWFLRRMGRSYGAVVGTRSDHRVQTVIGAYDRFEFFMKADRFFIGRDHDDIMPMVMFYDLAHRARDDARVISRVEHGGPWQIDFETFREQLAYSALLRFGVQRSQWEVEGSIRHPDEDFITRAREVLEPLGFVQPVPTGEYCGLFTRDDQTLLISADPDGPSSHGIFGLGGSRQGVLRQVLGHLVVQGGFETRIDKEKQAG